MGEEGKGGGDENKARGNWGHKMDFMLSVIGFAVGLGNVWRFPYRAYQNGGASFLVPYILVLVLAGIPMFFIEMAVGQFASLGPISVWKMVPFFKGIGWGMVFINFLCSIYYNMIIAYTLRYFFASMQSTLPWSECRPEWIKLGCVNRARENSSLIRNITKEWCNEIKAMNDTNLTSSESYIVNCTLKSKTPSELYWERDVLDMVPYIGHPDGGVVKWDLALSLLLAWIIVFFCLIKGIKSTGKVVYFTAIFPYVVLVILLIWNARLDGAETGIRFYVIPRWERLSDATVWYSAGSQIFYSLGIAFGGLQTMSSYNRFHNNVYRDAIIIAVINCGTSIFAGFVIFSVVGFMAKQTNSDVSEVVAAGPGLAFIAYPEGIALMPVPQLWAVLFFLMLFTLGIDSQFVQIETVITAIVDEFKFFQGGRRKFYLMIGTCCFMYLLGLPFCTRAGIYAFTIFDWYSAGLNIIVICIIEIIAMSYIYGFHNICDDIKMMIGHRPNYYFVACWVVLTPLMMLFIFIFSCIQNTVASYGDYVFPDWFDGMGWLMFALTMLLVIVTAAYQTFTYLRNGEHWKELFRPTEDWGPALEEHRTGRYTPFNKRDGPELNNGKYSQRTDYDLAPPPIYSIEKPGLQEFDNPGYNGQVHDD